MFGLFGSRKDGMEECKIGDTAVVRSNFAVADHWYQRAFTISGNVLFLIKRADLLYKLKSYKAAGLLYEKALQQASQNFELYQKLASAYLNENAELTISEKKEKALAVFIKGAEKYGKNGKFLLGMGIISYDLGEFELALSCIKEALQLKVSGREADDLYVLLKLAEGKTQLALGNVNTAAVAFYTILGFRGFASPEHNSRCAEAHAGLGEARCYFRQYKDALEHCENALKRDPDCVAAHFGKANAHYFNKQFDAALKSYDEVLKRDPDHFYANCYKANILYLKENYKAAYEHFQKAMQARPAFISHVVVILKASNTHNLNILHPEMGLCLAKPQRFKQLKLYYHAKVFLQNLLAGSDFSKYLLVDFENFEQRAYFFKKYGDAILKNCEQELAISLVLHAKQLNFLDEHESAIKEFAAVLTVDKHNHDALFGQGNAYFALNNLDKARGCYEEALKIQNDDIAALVNLGVVCRQQNRLADAIKYFLEALKINPNYFPAHFNLACAYAHNKQQSEAMKCYVELQKLNQQAVFASVAMDDVHFDTVGDLGSLNLVDLLGEEALRLKQKFNKKQAQNLLRENLALAKKQAIDEGLISADAKDEKEVAADKAAPSSDFKVEDKNELQKKHERLLFQAARIGDLAELERLKKMNVNLGARDRGGMTGLHIAAEAGVALSVIAFFIEQGACGVNDKDLQGETPLYKAVKNNDTSTVAELVKRGANLDLTYKQAGKDPFIPAKDKPTKQVFSGVMPESIHATNFHKHDSAPDGSCGFTSLQKTRKEVRDCLMQAKEDKVTLAELAVEIVTEFKAYALTEITTTEYKKLSGDYKNHQGRANELLKNINAEVRKSVPDHKALNNLEEAAKYLAADAKNEGYNKLLQEVASVQNEGQELEQKIQTYCASTAVYTPYVEHLGRTGWLGCISAKVFARLSGFNLYIWVQVDGRLVCSHHYVASTAATTPTFHMLYNNRDHFDRLIPVPLVAEEKARESKSDPTDKTAEAELSVLAFAIKAGKSLPVIEILIQRHDSVDSALIIDGVPLLHLAAKMGNDNFIRHLVTVKKANVNAQSKDFSAPLVYAAVAGHKSTVATLLSLGAMFDEATAEGQALLKRIEKEVSDQEVRQEIINRLRNYSDQQRYQREMREKLVNVIFICLFADTLELEKTNQNYAKTRLFVQDLLRLIMQSSPYAAKSLAKLDLEKSTYEMLKNSRVGTQFLMFMRSRVVPGQVVTPDQMKKWYLEMPENKEQNTAFVTNVTNAMQEYCESGVDNVWLESIVERIIQGIPTLFAKVSAALKEKIDEKYLREHINQVGIGNLKQWIKVVLSKDARFKTVVLEEKSEQQLIENIQMELVFPLAEKTKKEKKHFYLQRIKSGLENWLYMNNYLVKEDRFFYEMADKIVMRLRDHAEQMKKDKEGMKAKKMGLARLLIKEILQSSNKFTILSERADEFIAAMILKLQKHPMKYFSVKIKCWTAYQVRVRGEVYQWFFQPEQSRASFSISRSVSRSLSLVTSYSSDSEDEIEEVTPLSMNKNTFINEFLACFDLLFAKFQALDKGLVNRIDEEIDKASAGIDQHKDKLPKFKVMGIEIGLGDVASACASFGVYLKDISVAKAARRMTELFELHNPWQRCKVLKAAAEFFMNRYQRQLEQLDPEGVRTLAHCAANRVVNYIISEDKNQIKSAPSIWDKVKGYVLGGPTKKKEFEGPLGVMIIGMIRGKSKEFDTKRIKALDHKRNDTVPWTAEAFFENTGLIVVNEQTGEETYYIHKNVPLKPDGQPVYGYRYGSLAEAKGYREVKPSLPHAPSEAKASASPRYTS